MILKIEKNESIFRCNVLVSVLNKEYPVFTFSSRLLSLADVSKIYFTLHLCV
jgi:hypothetical protein